ncbi:MAG: hypothetical protein J0L92_14075 [Deltaproteobacteria bacterium]|nr:hypothetical protein [Deltaproteobacteria bacterium]
MLAIAHDSARLIDVVVHGAEPVSAADVLVVETACRRAAKAIAQDPRRTSVVLVLVETDQGPDAAQRQRLARAMRSVPRCLEVLVTESWVARANMEAMRVMAPSVGERRLAAFRRYEEARDFLVRETGFEPTVFDALVTEARGRVRGELGAREHATLPGDDLET